MPVKPPVKKRGPYKPRKARSQGQDGEDLLGGFPATPQSEEPDLDGLDLGVVFGGVSAAWLAHVFGADKNTIKKKLARCEIAGKNRGTPLYRIKDAAEWLVKPKVDVDAYIRSMRPCDVPPQLNDAYWSAMGKRQKVLKDAKDTWDTEDVLQVFGSAALKIKGTVQLWEDEVDRVYGLSDEQRTMIRRMADGLLMEIHDIFVRAPREACTRSTIVEHEYMLGRGVVDAETEEEEDEIEDLL